MRAERRTISRLLLKGAVRRDGRNAQSRERMVFCCNRAASLRRRAFLVAPSRKPRHQADPLHYRTLLATARDYLREARYWLELLASREPDHVLHGGER